MAPDPQHHHVHFRSSATVSVLVSVWVSHWLRNHVAYAWYVCQQCVQFYSQLRWRTVSVFKRPVAAAVALDKKICLPRNNSIVYLTVSSCSVAIWMLSQSWIGTTIKPCSTSAPCHPDCLSVGWWRHPHECICVFLSRAFPMSHVPFSVSPLLWACQTFGRGSSLLSRPPFPQISSSSCLKQMSCNVLF